MVELTPTRVHPFIRWMSMFYLIPKREILRHRIRRTVIESIGGADFVVPPAVFNPVTFRTGRYFSEFIAGSEICDPARYRREQNSRALDCTTGTGAQAVMLARRGFDVTAVDINPEAVRAAKCNTLLNGVDDRISIVEGNLFEPVIGQTFEIVVSALPLFRGEPKSQFELCWRSPDIIERFAAGLADVLTDDGVSLALFTSDGDEQGFLDALRRNALNTEIAARKHFGSEIMSIYTIRK